MSKRILIVEDERIVALDLKYHLKSMDYDVVGMVSNGRDAITQAGALRPDLILMDVNLEGEMRGTEAACLIRQRYRIPVLFLTAYAENNTLHEAAESAPYGYLVKPYETRELNASIRMAFSRHDEEQAVERSEERLRLAVEAAELGIWEWSQKDDSLEIGGHFQRIIGGTPQRFSEGEDAFLNRVVPEHRELVQQAFGDDSRTGYAMVRVQRDDGKPIWVELFARRHVYGSEPMLIGVIRDITERRQVEEQLRQASVVFRTTAEGIVILDNQLKIIAVNPAFSELTGISEEKALGQETAKLLYSRPHSQQFYQQLASSEDGNWFGEVTCKRANGKRFPAWEHLCAVRDEKGDVVQFVSAFTDVSAIREAEEELNHLAYHDALTNLGNRHHLNERLSHEVQRSKRSGIALAVLFLDLDGFKHVNDTMGHSVGDTLLKHIARNIQQALRKGDMAFRHGGDEFVILATEVGRAMEAANLAERLLKAAGEPMDMGDEQLIVSASIGIALYPENGDTPEGLLQAADNAMYNAKQRGRNRYAFYSIDMAERVRERMRIDQGLRVALEEQQFELWYQPQINLATGQPLGVEALIRWRHPEHGIISPDRFIPIAEECGLIESIGNWVLETACRQGVAWLEDGLPEQRMAVNVSVRQFMAEGFVESVVAVLNRTGFPAQLLELEITETLLQAFEESQRIIKQLKEVGFGVALDDFGTGFSSLSLLKHLPLDKIKIDRSFVQDLPGDHNDEAITLAILGLGQAMGIAITAEGIETAEQLAFLQAHDCQFGQGYYFAKPLPAADVTALLSVPVS